MTRKGYKQIRNALYREIKQRLVAEHRITSAEAEAERAKEEAEYYKKRFRDFGSNVETVEPDNGKIVQMLKWELKPQAWGHYVVVDDVLIENNNMRTVQRILADKVIEGLAKGLIERNLVQFITKGPESYNPLNRHGTYAAKLYVVPWEQMPHGKILELKHYSDEVIK